MTRRQYILPLHLALAALASAVGCGDQPKPNCLTSTAPFAMRLIEKSRQESTPGACMGFGATAFNADPEVGFISYYALDSKSQPDYAKGSLAVQTTEIGTLFFTAQDAGIANTTMDGGKVYSLGPYNVTEPGADNICTVPTMSPTHIVLAAIPPTPDDPNTTDDESDPGQPAVDAQLVWSNLKVYVTAASFGTQVQGDLVDTRRSAAGTCTITYSTLSLAPAVSCRLTDADGNPMMNTDGTYMVDATLCDPNPDPAKDRFTGSGISPNTDYVCSTESGFCVVNGNTIPALK